MKRKLQTLARTRSATLFRRHMKNRRLRRWWRATVVMPLAQDLTNTRANRAKRLAELTARSWVTMPGNRTVTPRPRRKKVWHRRRYQRG